MEALYIMIPLTLLLSGTALAACIWAIRKGQFDDVETPPLRILNDFEEQNRE
jgi:cbb3-type cytochrome oxidase maturation protein